MLLHSIPPSSDLLTSFSPVCVGWWAWSVGRSVGRSVESMSLSPLLPPPSSSPPHPSYQPPPPPSFPPSAGAMDTAESAAEASSSSPSAGVDTGDGGSGWMAARCRQLGLLGAAIVGALAYWVFASVGKTGDGVGGGNGAALGYGAVGFDTPSAELAAWLTFLPHCLGLFALLLAGACTAAAVRIATRNGVRLGFQHLVSMLPSCGPWTVTCGYLSG